MGEVTPITDRLTARFGERVTVLEPFRGQLAVQLAPADLIEVLSWLRAAEFKFLADVTAVDRLPAEPRFEVVYHLFGIDPPARLRVKVPVAEAQAVPTLTGLWSGANYSEREVFDLMGIPFSGHPHLTRILMPDDHEGHPLRKDVELGAVEIDFDLPHRKRFSHAVE
jgi:NADH-quinone oxidoreductase subunit C